MITPVEFFESNYTIREKDIDIDKSVCWWDCQPFERKGPRIPAVTRYFPRSGTFYLTGTFCSWNCSYSYCRDRNHDIGNLNLYCKKVLGHFIHRFRPAFPRIALEQFGGPLTIEQFRTTCVLNTHYMPNKNFIEYKITSPPEIWLIPKVLEKKCKEYEPNQILDVSFLQDAEIVMQKKKHQPRTRKKGVLGNKQPTASEVRRITRRKGKTSTVNTDFHKQINVKTAVPHVDDFPEFPET
jgi:hypothetical protein